MTPTSRRLAAVRRPWRALKAAPRAPISRAETVGAPLRRLTRPPSWSVITSSGSRSFGGRGIACRRAIRRRPAARVGKFSAKRTTPAIRPCADRRPQRRRDRGAREADDDPLARQQLRGQRLGDARLRRLGPVPSVAPKAKAASARPTRRKCHPSPPCIRPRRRPTLVYASIWGSSMSRVQASGTIPRLRPDALPDHRRRGPRLRPPHRPRRDRSPGRTRLGGAPGELRQLDRHVLAGQRQVRRLRRGLRLLRPVPLRRGGHADARDDGAGADPRARESGRGGRRPPLLHGHPGPGPLEAGLPEDPRGDAAGRRADQPQALRLDRPHVGGAGEGAEGGRRPAGPPQRRVGALLLPGGLDHGPLRGPAADDPGGQGGRAGDLRRRHPQPRRDRGAAGRDGLRALRDQPHLGADQPPDPEGRDQVRRPRGDGPLGGREVDRDLPPDHPRRPLPPLRRPGREPRRAARAGGQGRAERGDDGQLPHHARRRAGRRPGDVRRARPQRRPPARQRRQPAARQPLRLARGRDAGDADGRADRQPGRGELLGPLDPAAGRQEAKKPPSYPRAA